MKSDLEELIDAYQHEKTKLEKQISKCVEEGDYLNAHYHNKALNILNKTLNRLKTLHNPAHQDILTEEMRINSYNKMRSTPYYIGSNDVLKTYLDNLMHQNITESEEKINNFKNTEIQAHHDSQEIDDALFGLVKGDIKRFTLYFKSSTKECIQFDLIDQAIQIKILLDEDFNAWKQKQLRHNGFSLENNEWKYKYLLDQFKDAIEIKMLLSHLIYDVFNYDSRYDAATLVYH
jgi:hypothetical protein